MYMYRHRRVCLGGGDFHIDMHMGWGGEGGERLSHFVINFEGKK